MIGYLAGAGLRAAEQRLGLASEIVFATVVVLGIIVALIRRQRARRHRVRD